MLRLRVLGGMALDRDGVALDGAAAQRRPLALLAILALAGETSVSRDRLCSFLWPESDVERARGSLKQSLYALRRDVGTAELVVGSTDLRLNREMISCDVWEFRRALVGGDLELAVSNYAGPLLDGLHLRDADDFERWSEEVRRELATQHAKALQQLTKQAAERGDRAGTVVWARKWSVAEPLGERAVIQFMMALDAVGDRAGALKQGEIHRGLLRAELDVEPGPAMLQLLARLRVRDLPVAPEDEIEPEAASAVEPMVTDDVVADVATYADAVAPADAVGIVTPHSTAASMTRRSWRRSSGVVIVAVGLTLGGVAWLMGSRTRHAAPRRLTFALMPIGVASADSSLATLQRDLDAAVTAQIVATGRVAMLRLADRSAARDAGADHLVVAIVELASDGVTVRASIHRAIDGQVEVALDAISVPRAEARTIVPIVSDHIGGAVAALSDTLYRAWALAGSRTPSYAAYQAFSLALESIAHHDPDRPMQPIVEQLATASRLDSTFAAARVLLIEQSDFDNRMRALSDSVQAVALAQRPTLGSYDAAALDNIVAIRAGEWEAALTAARRMVTIAPTLPDGHYAVARAQMATRRYRGALASLDTIARQPAWFAPRPELWQWDLAAHHALGEYKAGVAHFARLVVQHPDDYELCLWGLPDLVALGREAAVDALVAQCVSLVGTGDGPANIPNRAYFDIVMPHYLAHDNRAGAMRAAARVRPFFEKYAASQPAKARDLATMDCMLGAWALCYAPLAKWSPQADNSHLGRRRLGVAAAHMRDTAGVRAALLAKDSAAAWLHRGYALLSHAMILAATAGKRDSAVQVLTLAMEAGAAPSATEWVAWPATPKTWVSWNNDWYHAWELLPLRGDPVFEGMLRPRKE